MSGLAILLIACSAAFRGTHKEATALKQHALVRSPYQDADRMGTRTVTRSVRA